MGMLQDEQKEQLNGIFAELKNPVELVFFTKEKDCEHCQTTRELLEDLDAISDNVNLTVKDFEADGADVEKYGVDKVPAIVVEGERDFGIRFYGVPAGYEFTSLIKAVIAVGNRDHGLDDDVLRELEKIDVPVSLQVMVTTACPYCPTAVHTAHMLAMANDNIVADMVETAEFPDLVEKFNVQGVPHTIINDEYGFVGPAPELEVAYSILMALDREVPQSFLDAIEAAAKHEHVHGPNCDHGHEGHGHDD